MSIKPSLRNYVPGEPVIRFWSNAGPPYYSLSNFAFIEGGIEHQGYTYLSTEHAFQAQKYIKNKGYVLVLKETSAIGILSS